MSAAMNSHKTMTIGEGGLLAFIVVGGLTSLVVAGRALDTPMQIHSFIFALAAVLAGIAVLKRYYDRPAELPPQEIDGLPNYNMGIVKFLTVISVFWGVVGFLAALVVSYALVRVGGCF